MLKDEENSRITGEKRLENVVAIKRESLWGRGDRLKVSIRGPASLPLFAGGGDGGRVLREIWSGGGSLKEGTLKKTR